MSLIWQHSEHELEAGCDEAGRGCLAGPVVAAAVILWKNSKSLAQLNDSKKLSEKKRNYLYDLIKNEALAYGIAFISPEKIDEINILNASFLAMSEAVKKLNPQPHYLLIDGNRFKSELNIPFECMVRGDAKYASIAAASILAKVERDNYMAKLHQKFPDYDWLKNKGYPTKKHREAISNIGISEHHRQTFRQLPNQISLDF